MYFPSVSIPWYHITLESRGRLKVITLKHGIDPNTWQHLFLCFSLSVFVLCNYNTSFVAFAIFPFIVMYYKKAKKPRQYKCVLHYCYLDIFYIHCVIKDSSLGHIILFFLFSLLHRPDVRLKPKVLSSPVCSAYHKSDLTDIFFKENEYPPTLCRRAMVFVWSMWPFSVPSQIRCTT